MNLPFRPKKKPQPMPQQQKLRAATTTLSPGSAVGQYGTLTVGNGLPLNGTTIPLNISSNPAGPNDSIKIQGGTLTNGSTVLVPVPSVFNTVPIQPWGQAICTNNAGNVTNVISVQ